MKTKPMLALDILNVLVSVRSQVMSASESSYSVSQFVFLTDHAIREFCSKRFAAVTFVTEYLLGTEPSDSKSKPEYDAQVAFYLSVEGRIIYDTKSLYSDLHLQLREFYLAMGLPKPSPEKLDDYEEVVIETSRDELIQFLDFCLLFLYDSLHAAAIEEDAKKQKSKSKSKSKPKKKSKK